MHYVWGCENVPMAGRERAGPDNTEITQVLTRSGNWGHCQDFIIKHEEWGHGHQGEIWTHLKPMGIGLQSHLFEFIRVYRPT